MMADRHSISLLTLSNHIAWCGVPRAHNLAKTNEVMVMIMPLTNETIE
jgi:hypothetical protein